MAVDFDAGSPGERVGAVWLSPNGVSCARVPHGDAVFGDGLGVVETTAVIAGGPGFTTVDRQAAAALEGLGFADQVFQGAAGSVRGHNVAVWISP